MTNQKTLADIYLKDGIDYGDLSMAIGMFLADRNQIGPVGLIKEFFEQPVKPTLTEDEKVILRNVKKLYKFIGKRELTGTPYISMKSRDKYLFATFDLFDNDLFQFIQPRRRI